MSAHEIVVAPGDGVGPEITAAAVDVTNAVASSFGFEIRWIEETVGAACIQQHGTALREGAIDRARQAGAVLFGAVGDPRFDGSDAAIRPERAILDLRAGLELFANVRPIRTSAVDLVIVRELIGGIYFGEPRERTGTGTARRALDTCVYTEPEIRRVVDLAFSMAADRQRRVTSVDKANVLASSQLWREVASEVGLEHPEIVLEHRYVDSCAMDLVRTPEAFDVMVMGNLFGDILSDLAAVLAGSIGVLPSASLGTPAPDGTVVGLYEPIHGSAPTLTGKDVANPVGTILSAAMLLRHSLRRFDAAQAVEAAVSATVAEGFGTPDLRPPRPIGTRAFGAEVARRLRSM